MESPIACSACGALNPEPPQAFDCFELFGLQRRFDIDLGILHQKYLTLSQLVHPDMAGQESDDAHQYTLALSAKLNRAYETLKQPARRAEYLLTLAGGPTAAENKDVPGQLLSEIMVLREDIEEAKEADDTAALHQLRERIQNQSDRVMHDVAALCGRLDPKDDGMLKTLREQLNGLKYWENLLDQLSAVE
jgi:molecular chaperone HscB